MKMLSQKFNPDAQSPLGTGVWGDDQIVEHSHHGSTGNYECIVRKYYSDDITVILLTNQKNGNVRELSEKILKLVRQNRK